METRSHQADVLVGGDSQVPGPDQAAPADLGQSGKHQDENSLVNHHQDGPEQVEKNTQQPPDQDDISNYAVAPQGAVPPSPTYDYLNSEDQEGHRNRYLRESRPERDLERTNIEYGTDHWMEHDRRRAEGQVHDWAADELFQDQEMEMLRSREYSERREEVEAILRRAERDRQLEALHRNQFQRAEWERERARLHRAERERDMCERERAMLHRAERERHEAEARRRRYEAEGWRDTGNQGRTNNFYFFN